MNTHGCEVVDKTKNNESFNVLMLLKEAELFNMDVRFVTTASEPLELERALNHWLVQADNLHEARLHIYGKPRIKACTFAHPKHVVSEIDDSFKVKQITETMLIGKDVVIINTAEGVLVTRQKNGVLLAERMIKALVRITKILGLAGRDK